VVSDHLHPAFREDLLERLGRPDLETGRNTQKRYTNAEFKDHDLAVARKIVKTSLELMGHADRGTNRARRPLHAETEG